MAENNFNSAQRNQKTSLDAYLKELTLKGSQNPLTLGGIYDPKVIPLTRLIYGFYEDKIFMGAPKDVPEARKKRRKTLEKKFEELIKNPSDVSRLVDYAEAISDDGYFEIAQSLIGKAILLDPRNPQIYHLLSKINLELAEICKRNKRLSLKYSQKAEGIAERGIEFVDEIAIKLAEDKIDALSRQGKSSVGFRTRFDIWLSEKHSPK